MCVYQGVEQESIHKAKMTDVWQTVNNKRGVGSAQAFGSAPAFGSAQAFGNGAFGARRTTTVSPLAVSASASASVRQQAAGAYVPPGKRVHVETFDEAFPQLGGIAVPLKGPTANSDKPLLSDMVAELALKEAVEKEIAATKKRRAELNKEELGELRLPSLSEHVRKVALRQAEKERREFQEDMEFLASKYTLFRCELNHLYKPKEEEYFEEEVDYSEDYESSEGGAGDEHYDEEY